MTPSEGLVLHVDAQVFTRLYFLVSVFIIGFALRGIRSIGTAA